MNDVFEKAQGFIHRNARPLDLARWRFHFEHGSREDVLNALSYYQNGDGGFGHALEADAWNPHSSPIQTWAATEILREISFRQGGHPLVRGLLRYLDSGQDFDGHHWDNTVASNDLHPHAPWWHRGSQSSSHHPYNPTACLAGFLLWQAESGSRPQALGRRLALEACEALMDGGPLHDMHTAACYVRLMQYAGEAGGGDLLDLEALKSRLGKEISQLLTGDKSLWDRSYVCRPSQFIQAPDSPFYPDNRSLADDECEHIKRTQLPDGSWPVTWGWADYPEAWAVSKNWWKSTGVIRNLRYLAAMTGDPPPFSG
ncbi:MAG: hypothetical protein AB9880_11600 [Christensenellales bacterium]